MLDADVERSRGLADLIIDQLAVGIVAVDRALNIVQWNRFMALHTNHAAAQVLGRPLFEIFPELPRKWLEKKIFSVFTLKNFAFTSWQERPYLFRFRHGRPITGGIDVMQQNCTLIPLVRAGGTVEAVCIALFDVTDVAIVQRQLEVALATVSESANRDGLTGLFNRRHMEQRLSEELARYRRHGRELAPLIVDIDHFKQINDRYGHLAGDAVLRAAAQRVAGLIRQSDVFCRYGGEEFVLVLPETGAEAAMIVAEKVRKAAAATPFEFEGIQVQVTISIGAAAARPTTESGKQLIADADGALYAAKRQGRNRCIAFEPSASS